MIVAKVETKRQHNLLTILILNFEATNVKRNNDYLNDYGNGCIIVLALFLS